MIICPKCLSVNKNKDQKCTKCGVSIDNISEKENRENLWRYRLKHRLRSHMLTGFLLCAGLPILLDLITINFTFTAFIVHIIFGFIFGVPLGYLVSRFSESIIGGVAIGCSLGLTYYLLVWLIFGGPFSVIAAFSAVVSCIIPGGIMGLHAESDS